uniref:Reverse transcriptase N-terminal domain-containing protein n=1 Tax=Sonderella linearis TaxID=110477 RepID=A0A1Z1MM56_9FLOR|nr:hypothetical protein [Sonderella linearis]ARW67016.1 hypothetical protein [Sonderella linearis]
MISNNQNWDKLPWIKINLRILMLQKKIYIASKKCNLYYLYKVQNYLMNSNEAKVLAIHKTLEYISRYYNTYNKEQYVVNNYDKVLILKFLYYFEYLKNQIFIKIIENIKQYLLYLCIQPEWKAKFSKKIDHYFYDLDLLKINNYTKKYYFNLHIIQKLRGNKFITQSIKNWLHNNHCINFDHISKASFQKNEMKDYSDTSIILSYLYRFLNKIILIDYNWYFFYNLKNNFILKRIKSKNNYILYINEKNNIYLYSLHKIIKLTLYRINHFNYLKINSSLKKNTLLYKFSIILQELYKLKLNFISLKKVKITCFIVNKSLHHWLKKHIKINNYFIKYKKNYINIYNDFLNRDIYNQNINKYYVEYFLFLDNR